MKLGLVRHFKVITEEKTFLSSSEFADAMKNYDKAPIHGNGLKINSSDWDVCFTSTLPRAISTAEAIFSGKIIKSDLLVEVPISPFTKKNIKRPSFIWHIGSRIAWYKSHRSQQENISGTRERIKIFQNMIVNSDYKKILIVSHGYFLRIFFEEMRKRGRTDSNQSQVVDDLRKLGISVAITSNLGDGFPDLLLGYGFKNLLVELKDGDNKPPSACKLTDDEIDWHEAWRGEAIVANNVDEILEYLGILNE